VNLNSPPHSNTDDVGPTCPQSPSSTAGKDVPFPLPGQSSTGPAPILKPQEADEIIDESELKTS
jgi:hypothetical protein